MIAARLALLCVVWGALAFGAVYPWAYWPLAAACAAIGVWAIATRASASGKRRDPIALGLGAIAVGIALQMVPIPGAVLSTVAPGADGFLRQFDVAYGLQQNAWHSLSISPSDTLVTSALFASLALFLIGLMRAASTQSTQWLVTRLAMFGVSLAVLGVIQRATHTEAAYGFWKPTEGRPVPFGPFINRNHFAGWMLMATPLALGYFCGLFEISWRQQGRRLSRWLLWLTRPQASQVALIGLSIVAMGVSLVLTGSRSGVGSFAVALTAIAAAIIRRTSSRSARALALVGVIALLGGAITWAGIENSLGRFSSASEDVGGRLAAWSDATHIIRAFPLFGTGLGTFGLAMLVYQTQDRAFIYFQAHNDYLQLAAEGGLLVGIPILLTLGALATGIWRRFRAANDDALTHWIRVGAVAGLAGIAAQSLMEFSLQMPGNAVLFVVILAVALHKPDDELAAASRAAGMRDTPPGGRRRSSHGSSRRSDAHRF